MALGKSLNNILEDYFGTDEPNTNKSEAKAESKGEMYHIPVDKIVIGDYQTRENFDEEALAALAASIRDNGLIQPILVYRNQDDTFTLLAGERRLRAVKRLKHETIEAKVLEENKLTSSKKMFLTAYENLLREDLNPIELANTFRLILRENNMTEKEFAKVLGKSEKYVTHFLQLLSLEDEVQALLITGKLLESHARPLIMLEPKEQIIIAHDIVDNNLTQREIQASVRLKRIPTNSKKTYSEILRGSNENDHPLSKHPAFAPYQDIKKEMHRHMMYPKIMYSGSIQRGRVIISW